MTIPTGHQTITHEDNFRSQGALWRNAREGDTYIDKKGRHWLNCGTFVKPEPLKESVNVFAGLDPRARMAGQTPMGTWHGPAAQQQNLPKDWRQERGIPAGCDARYETSYTKKVVDQLLSRPVHSRHHPFIVAATSLLVDYHKSLHAPYEQRDKARQDLVVAEAQRDQALQALKRHKSRMHMWLGYLRGDLQD